MLVYKVSRRSPSPLDDVIASGFDNDASAISMCCGPPAHPRGTAPTRGAPGPARRHGMRRLAPTAMRVEARTREQAQATVTGHESSAGPPYTSRHTPRLGNATGHEVRQDLRTRRGAPGTGPGFNPKSESRPGPKSKSRSTPGPASSPSPCPGPGRDSTPAPAPKPRPRRRRQRYPSHCGEGNSTRSALAHSSTIVSSGFVCAWTCTPSIAK